MTHKHIFILFTVLTLMILSGCVRNSQVRGVMVVPAETHSHTTTVVTHYPPPHAPAHGHRHRYYNHDLQFDAGFGAYLVIGSPGIYFYDDHYLRYLNGTWQYSIRLNQPWRPAKQNFVPHKLWDRHRKGHREDRHEQRREEKRHVENHHRRDDRRSTPRHGHRRDYRGRTLTYDAGIGAYRILKQPDIIFYNDRYVRHYRGTWQVTNKLNSKWRNAKEQQVPGKLWKKKDHNYSKRDKERYDYKERRSERHKDEYRRHDGRKDERRKSDRRKDKKRSDEDRRYEESSYEDRKQLRGINEKFFEGMQQQ